MILLYSLTALVAGFNALYFATHSWTLRRRKVGALVLMGFVIDPLTPSRLRTMMGMVLLLFGVFRGVLLYSQRTIHHGKEEEA